MKPVAIFRHFPTEGPGYFAIYLERRGVPWRLIRLDAGERVPSDCGQFSGACFMGGPMSVNDPLPWIGPALEFIRRCVSTDVPVIGHCLGGQLVAKALGGTITPFGGREIGWHEVEVSDSDVARHWFGQTRRFTPFHWHGERFSLPAGATPVLASALCAEQGFVVGPHIGMQCHIEMTADLIGAWCANGADEIAANPGSGVQTAAQIEEDLAARLAAMHIVAECVYGRWAEGLRSKGDSAAA
jgi:GMP synthase-like glutamine amidotransferase